MAIKSIHEFEVLGHKIEILEERRSMTGVSSFEERLGIEVRYGLKFDGEVTDWSDYVEALEDEASAHAIAQKGEERAKRVGQKPKD